LSVYTVSMMTTSVSAEQHGDAGSPGATVTEIEKLDGALLDTLGASGSMITGGLAIAGVGLAVGGILGLVAGAAVGLGIGALGAVGRTSGMH
jgi:hypothetical protein